MINDLIEFFTNKKIIILGFGREGTSTYKLIRKYLPNKHLYIADKRKDFQLQFDFLQEDNNITFISGENYLDNLQNYEIIMKAPGISFVGIDTSSFVHNIKSQLELLLEFFDIYTIGITGTKGKSTTSSLIYSVLKEQNIKSMLLGNIGVPVFDYIDKIEKDMVLVLEMSSHQLEYMESSPNISVITNIYEEHLDHYDSFEKYAEAKCNIYKFQSPSDYFLYNFDNSMLKKLVHNNLSQTFKISLEGSTESDIYLKNNTVFLKNEELYNKNDKRNLQGDYNLNNIMFVLGIAKILNLNLAQTIKTINEFKTLAHRLELVGEINNVLYYDNSIGTVPMATIEAVKALGNVDTLIIGGMDRGLDYTEFTNYLNSSNISNIICMPKTGHDIAKNLVNSKKHIVETLEEAVTLAKKITKKNKSCLLSPAAASYGFFKNFEEKGDLFKKLVLDN